jgi:hypothetical protein
MSSLSKNIKEETKNILTLNSGLVLIPSEKHTTEKIYNGKELLKSFPKLNLFQTPYVLKIYCKENWEIVIF